MKFVSQSIFTNIDINNVGI